MDGFKRVSDAGYRLSCTNVDEDDLIPKTRDVMHDAIWITRYVGSDHDGNPHKGNDQYQTGEYWWNQLWPHMADARGSDFFQFVNEWEGNFETVASYIGYGNFYMQLGTVGRANGVVVTYGDFSMGTPPDANNVQSGEAFRFAALHDMFTDAGQHGNPVNVHLYSPQGAGAFDMEPGKDFYVMRWEQIASRFPNVDIIAGEGGNYGDGGRTYDATLTPRLWKQAAGLLRASPYFGRFKGLHWWGVVDGNAHPDWKQDDITGSLPYFFDWSCQGQPDH